MNTTKTATPAHLIAAAKSVISGYAGLDKAMGTVKERNLAFLKAMADAKLSRSVAPSLLGEAKASAEVIQRFKQWMSDNKIANNAEGIVATTSAGAVVHTPKAAQPKAEKAPQTPVAPAPSEKPAEGEKPQTKGDVLASAERGLRIASEKLRGMALPATCKTAEQACKWMLEQLQKAA